MASEGGNKANDQEIRQQLIATLSAEVAKKGGALKTFLDMAQTFTDIIPEESKRYLAALKALKQSANIDVPKVLESADEQIEELKKQKEKFLSGFGEKRAGIKAMESKIKDIRGEVSDIHNKINELKQKIESLEKVEHTITERIKSESAVISLQEESFDSALKSVESGISDLKNKIKAYTSAPAEAPAASPAPAADQKVVEQKKEPVPAALPAEKLQLVSIEADLPATLLSGRKISLEPIAPSASKKVQKPEGPPKICPYCSSEMTFSGIWECYICGYREENKAEEKK